MECASAASFTSVGSRRPPLDDLAPASAAEPAEHVVVIHVVPPAGPALDDRQAGVVAPLGRQPAGLAAFGRVHVRNAQEERNSCVGDCTILVGVFAVAAVITLAAMGAL